MTARTESDAILDDEELRHGVRRPWLGPHRPLLRRVARPIVDFSRVEASGGTLLVAAAAVALLWANSPWQGSYHDLWRTELDVRLGGLRLHGDLRHWVNDAFMVLFFFVVGLEIKTELVTGHLADARRAALPVAAALGGMVVPAAVYVSLNVSGGGALEGWGVPVATDIAFALGLVALLGDRIPAELKVLLLAMAIVDDIGAVLIIAVFYTAKLSMGWLALSLAVLAVVALLHRIHVWYLPAYVLAGLALWLAVYESGVHATIAGVALGLLTPARPLLTRRQAEETAADQGDADPRMTAFVIRESVSVADRLAESLHPWTSYAVIPVFALANAGITFTRDMASSAATSWITWGVASALVVGKPLGMLVSVWLVTRFGAVSLPAGTTWGQLVGLGFVAGIGFTMALFIAGLAFEQGSEPFDQAKIGVFAASMVAAISGLLLLRATTNAGEADR